MGINGMRKIILVGVLVLVMAFIVLASEKSIDSIWTDSPLKIDGLADDWGDDPLHTEKKVKVEYAFRNDSDHLYVYFQFNDAKYLSSIEITGMVLWLDTGGKKKKDLGIKFTKKKISADKFIAMLEEQQGAISDERKENLRASEFYFISRAEAVNKKRESLDLGQGNGLVRGASFNVLTQQNKVAYEFKIPLGFMDILSEQSEKAHEIIGLGFEWGGLTDEMRKAYMKGDASGGTGRIGISEGGRGGGGGQSVGFDGASSAGLTALRKMTKKYSIWTVVRMANIQ